MNLTVTFYRRNLCRHRRLERRRQPRINSARQGSAARVCYTPAMTTERRLLRPRPRRWLAMLAGLGLLGALQSGVAQEARDTIKPTLHGKHWVAITGKPLAATAGALTFANGGNAVDAACAMLAAAATMWDTLSWGGETVALVYDPRAGKVRTINALGVAPTGATPEFFRGRGLHGPPDYGPLAATTPGTVGGLITMLSEFGTMSLEQVLGPAMQMAAGYPMEQTQALNIENSKELLVRWEASRRVLLPHYDPSRIPSIGLRRTPAKSSSSRSFSRRSRSSSPRSATRCTRGRAVKRRSRPRTTGSTVATSAARSSPRCKPRAGCSRTRISSAGRCTSKSPRSRHTKGSRSTSRRPGFRARCCCKR